MDRHSNTGTANPETGNEVNATAPRTNPAGGARAGAWQAADTMRITDGGTTGEGPVANASEQRGEEP